TPAGPNNVCGSPERNANSLVHVPPPQVWTFIQPCAMGPASAWNMRASHSFEVHAVSMRGSKVLSSSTAMMSGLRVGSAPMEARSCQLSRVASPGRNGGSFTLAFGIDTMKSDTKLLSIIASHTPLSYTWANGPCGYKITASSAIDTRIAIARPPRMLYSSRMSPRHNTTSSNGTSTIAATIAPMMNG